MARFRDIPQFTRSGSYEIDMDIDYLEKWLADHSDERFCKFEMDPDFQRAHVWTEEQQIRWLEFFFRGGRTGRVIYWNCPGWQGNYEGPMQLVDGKQRLTACLRFLRDEIPLCGALHREYTDRPRIINTLKMHVNDLKTRAEVLQWYIDLNAGGVVHSETEIGRVKALLAEELAKPDIAL